MPGIAPHRGWTLHTWDGLTGDGERFPAWVAHGPDDYVVLQCSRFQFRPTQARFAWLVDNTVLGDRRSGPGPWTDAKIDAEIAADEAIEAARVRHGRGSPAFRAAAIAFGLRPHLAVVS